MMFFFFFFHFFFFFFYILSVYSPFLFLTFFILLKSPKFYSLPAPVAFFPFFSIKKKIINLLLQFIFFFIFYFILSLTSSLF